MKLVARRGEFPEEVRQRGRYMLFVEGAPDSIDTLALSELFEHRIRVERLGPSFSVRSAAEALNATHPYYFFLIDRDNQTDEEVDRLWREFPNPQTANLLVWHSREIENVFLDPEYLMRSRYYVRDVRNLRDEIVGIAQKRLYLDVANATIVSCREELKTDLRLSLKTIKSLSCMMTCEDAVRELREHFSSDELGYAIANKTSPDVIERRFRSLLAEYTGERESLRWECGRWRQLMRGKKILHEIFALPCFRVTNSANRVLAGKDRQSALVEDLLRLPADLLPADFVQLKNTILGRLH